ncbi:hypothetical protein QJS66_21005 [Kocuria rhizophila]|nr:hypothetical protein QJS66_21005 [Kocuria rhizophila]
MIFPPDLAAAALGLRRAHRGRGLGAPDARALAGAAQRVQASRDPWPRTWWRT